MLIGGVLCICHVALYRETAKALFARVSLGFVPERTAVNRETLACYQETAHPGAWSPGSVPNSWERIRDGDRPKIGK